ncbi:hypothetical protein [Flexivirga meconopsidis]|uniref:hypothetical protein n=1 Tax=Flexivirga meconopsidis TaxID=2977121 RepID=UPI00223F12F9|nr:hypothetical protein [Flexivirga meconopsidis]
MSGVKAKDPGKVLDQARSSFIAQNQAAIDSKATSVDKDTDCFYRRTVKDSKDVVPNVFCGPVRRAGSDEAHSWDSYSVMPLGTDDPTAAGQVAVGQLTASNTTVDTDLLVRPDGKSPASVKALAQPQAPQSSVRDYALLQESSSVQSGLSFTPLKTPASVRTPSATITVQAQADATTVPAWFEQAATGASDSSGSSDSSSDGSYGSEDTQTPAPSPTTPGTSAYRPAAGQRVLAYKITVGPGLNYPDPNSSNTFGDVTFKDASASFSVGVGGQQIAIHQADSSGDSWSTDGSSAKTFSVACTDGAPCASQDSGSNDTTEYILIMSVASGGAPTITASVDGQNLSVPLAGGSVSASVSTVGQDGKSQVQQINSTVPSQDLKVDDYVEYQVSGSIAAAFLSPYDAHEGWAPKGQAWLEIPVPGSTESAEANSDLKLNWSKSGTVSADGKTYQASKNAGRTGTFGFLVPETFSTGTFTYAPQGTGEVGYPAKSVDFAAKPFTVKLTIPKG